MLEEGYQFFDEEMNARKYVSIASTSKASAIGTYKNWYRKDFRTHWGRSKYEIKTISK